MAKNIIIFLILSIFIFGCKHEANDVQKVSSVGIVPDSLYFSAIGDSMRLKASASDANGKVISNKSFVWSSGNLDIVSVNDSGWVKTVGPGSTAISAKCGGISHSVQVEVCMCVRENYFKLNSNGGFDSTARENISCDSIPAAVYNNGVMNYDSALKYHAIEIDDSNRVLMLEKKICE